MVLKKTTVKKPAVKPLANTDPNAYRLSAEDGFTADMTNSQMMAVMATRSSLAATTIKAYAGGGDGLEVTDLMKALREVGEEVSGGNMESIEKMLVNQALTLDTMFHNLAQRAHRQDSFKGIEVLMRLGLKAQAQARSTAEALALLKNPMPYIRQANIANGPQQVNNGNGSASGRTELSAPSSVHAGNFLIEQSKLLEADHGQPSIGMDTGATQTAGRANQVVETMGAIHRTKNR